MRTNLITRLKEEWNNLDPVDPLRGLIADAIDALAEAQPSKPLTDEELWKFWWARPDVPDGEDDSMEAEFVAAVRRILAAHGINENT